MHCSANVGAGRRHGRLLRPLRHRQDHALGRPRPHAHRRRRARLERPRRLQLRGRLLRQGHPAPRRGRAGDLRGHARCSARCSRTSSSIPRRGPWTSTPTASPRTPAPAIPSTTSRTTCRAASGGHPKNIVFLTADAFGVLPPIARLTAEQAMYHFLSGYTAKVAGTERGVTEPAATFSTCFGAPFLPLHPGVYAKMLGERIAQHGAQGLAGQHRLDRRPVRHRLADEARPHARDGAGRARGRARRRARSPRDPVFGFDVPTAVPDVPAERAGAARHLDATPRPTTRRRASWRACSARTSSSSGRRCRGGRRGGTGGLRPGPSSGG